MAVLLADPRTVGWSAPHGGGGFQPYGPKNREHLRPPPEHWESRPTASARLFVPLRREGERRFDLDNLLDLVGEVRAAQVGAASSSFVVQRGTLRRHRDGSATVVEGAQVIVIDMLCAPRRFERSMVALAEAIARGAAQPEVVVQIQRNGQSRGFMGISPA